MFNNSPSLSLDPSGRELIEKNTQLFDLSVNDMDLHQYLGGYVPPHWHGELELFVLLEGLVTVRIGDQSYELKPGRAVLSIQRSFMPLFQKPPLPACSAPLCSAPT